MELKTSILIVGGGTGGIAAAIAATNLDQDVVLVTDADWVGGQLTAQLVPADESLWVESVGGTARYRAYRQAVRRYYRDHYPLTPEARANPLLNPGNCMLNLCSYEPRVGVAVLAQMTAWAEARGKLRILRGWTPTGADTDHDRVRAVQFRHRDGRELVVQAAYVLDATDLGDLLPLTGAEYRVGSESQSQTGELHALPGKPDPTRVQAFTWCAAVSYDRRPGADHRIAKPARYEHFRNWRYEALATDVSGLRISFQTPSYHGVQQFALLPEEFVAGKHPFPLWIYRRVLAAANFPAELAPQEITLINWPMNDYFDGPVVDVPAAERERNFSEARELTRSLIYWLQHEAPRPDGGTGYPGVCPRPDVSGTADGLAQEPYIREGRRLEAQFMVSENHVGVHARTGFAIPAHQRLTPDQRRVVLSKKICAEQFPDSVGTGFYGIDIHRHVGGEPGPNLEVFPYQIPLGSLLPVRLRNLLPAAKNLGVTHLTNGCYRLHPTEWNIGEAAGSLAAYCLRHGLEPAQLRGTPQQSDFQALLRQQGVDLEWPEEHSTIQHPEFLKKLHAAGVPINQPRYYC